MRCLLGLLVLGLAAPALARPGFYGGLGFGVGAASGESVGYDRIKPDETGLKLIDGPALGTDIGSSAATTLRLGFNVLGYAALETLFTGQGSALTDADERRFAVQWHTGLRAYPLWHWQAQLPGWMQPLEPSLYWSPFLGLSYQVYVPDAAPDEVGWSKGWTQRLGASLEYFVVDFFKVSLDYFYVPVKYDNFIFNFDESENYPVEPPAKTNYNQVFLSFVFQFGPSQKVVRYDDEPVTIVPKPVTTQSPDTAQPAEVIEVPPPAPQAQPEGDAIDI